MHFIQSWRVKAKVNNKNLKKTLEASLKKKQKHTLPCKKSHLTLEVLYIHQKISAPVLVFKYHQNLQKYVMG